MRPMLTIAIDFDDTFTADVESWSDVIRILQRSGHVVICVSARHDTVGNRQEVEGSLPGGVCVLLCENQQKREFAKSNGYDVDIWIDDCPEAIPSKFDVAFIK